MTDTRIIAHMVTRNELDRYLVGTLDWLQYLMGDLVHVHDDRSDDGTYEYLCKAGVRVTQRAEHEPSFQRHEGRFRQAGWDAMANAFSPTTEDWILCLDADEMLLCTERRPEHHVRHVLDNEVERAMQEGYGAIRTHVAEFFGFKNSVPQMRVDGLWGTIEGIRLVRWQATGRFLDKEEASGSVPWGWTDPHCGSTELTIGHFGYVRPADRIAKYERYKDCRGHAVDHIESIRTEPTLVPWTGQESPMVVLE